MTPNRIQLSKVRARLMNPYALIEYLEERQTSGETDSDPITQARQLLENPYSYSDGNQSYTAVLPDGREIERACKSVQRKKSPLPNAIGRLSDASIQLCVKNIQNHLWKNRHNLWPEGIPADAVEMLDPEIVFESMGYAFEYVEGLGKMRGSEGISEIGATIDNRLKVVRVGSQFSPAVRLFTSAHELGHACLHPQMTGLHRDIPLDGHRIERNSVEIEANKFATYFLMPGKLVTQRFRIIFLADSFEFNEESAHALPGMADFNERSGRPTRRELSRFLASAQAYNGVQVTPLHKQFRVSVEAMAIRLEELNLVNG